MRIFNFKTLIIVFALMIISFSCVSAGSQTLTREQLQSMKLKDIEYKIKENEKKIKPKQIAKKKAEKTLGQLRKDLRYTSLKLKRTRKKLRKIKLEEKNSKKQIKGLSKSYKVKQDQFSKRLAQIYKTENMNFIEFVFSQNDFVSAANASYYFNLIMKADINLIDDIQRTHKELKSKTLKLKRKSRQIETLKKEVAKKEGELKVKNKAQRVLINKLKLQIAEIKKKNDDLERSSNEITRLIKKQGLGERNFYGTGSMIKPVHGWVSSKFGSRMHPIFKRKIFHRGVDLAAPKGYKIKASDTGVVIHVGQQKKYKGYGKVTVVSHGRRPKDGKLMATFYAHQSRILVKKGDVVTKGDTIGLVGSTGYATGPHLHFEIRIDGRPVDPLKYIK
jgi:murein DD-endopeptidase MepM/ murein hydrolase activator NlpD